MWLYILKGEYIPMRKNLAKIIALLMALVLVFSFAACGGDEEPTETNTENAAVVDDSAAVPGDDTDVTGDTTASEDASDDAQTPDETPSDGESKADASQSGSTSTSGAVSKPTDKAAGVKLFNDALAKVSSTTTYVDRKLTKQDLTLIGDLNSLGPVSDSFAKGSGNVNVKLSSLSAGDVSSYSVSESGNNYIMTFKLNTVSGGQELKHGKGGYMYFLTMDEVATVVNQIGKQIGGDSFEVNIKKDKSTIQLQGGQLVVTVDKTTGKMSKAVLDFTEVITGKCQTSLLGPMTVTADLVGVGKVTFTLK